jgi:hypothetical protein
MYPLTLEVADGGGGALTGQVGFEGGNDHEDGEKGPAYGRRGIELLGDGPIWSLFPP